MMAKGKIQSKSLAQLPRSINADRRHLLLPTSTYCAGSEKRFHILYTQKRQSCFYSVPQTKTQHRHSVFLSVLDPVSDDYVTFVVVDPPKKAGERED